MCGIAGLIGCRDRIRAEHVVGQMTAALARRGPDAEGFHQWLDAPAMFGHRRLSIYDLSDAGRQPMLTADGATGIVFNGAIYNFHDIRRELIELGFQFKSNCDTEVLLAGYVAWGIDAIVAKLRGMFAFAIWDSKLKKLFLVRDRLGVKPLLYHVADGEIAFASTARALRAGGVCSEIDPQAMAEFLEFGYVTDDRCIYQGVHKLKAATILEWSAGAINTRQYWSPCEMPSSMASFEDAVHETERIFLEAVKMRLEADVTVGALLSGGIDSSLICWAVSQLGADIKAFTVATPGDELDESADARETARALGIKHEVIALSGDQAPDLNELVSAYGEPFACSSALGMLRVSKAVRKSATVLLTGDGGDDVYLGYPEHRNLWRAQQFANKIPSAAASLWRLGRNAIPKVGTLRRAVHFADYASGGIGAVACAHPGLPIYKQNGILGERLGSARVAQREMPWSHGSGKRLLSDFLAYDRRTRFTGEYMTKVDGATMHYALEARAPFLDHELWNFASTLPYEVRLHNGQLKSILREIARRRLGARVADGRKRGFGIPVERWIAGPWRKPTEELFSHSRLEEEGWIHSGPVLKQLRDAAAAGIASTQLWYLFVLESWFRQERTAVNEMPAAVLAS